MTDTVNAWQAGPTEIELSDAGLRVSKADAAPEIAWASVRYVMGRPEVWVFLLVPSGTRIIPKSAVEPDQQEAFTAQLREWAGTKYRVRDK